MTRTASTIFLTVLLCAGLGCQRGKQQAVVIEPNAMPTVLPPVPGDPFGSASPAYARLVEVTNAALALPWSDTLEDFAPWLEEETVAVERALALLKAIRGGLERPRRTDLGTVELLLGTLCSGLRDGRSAARRMGPPLPEGTGK